MANGGIINIKPLSINEAFKGRRFKTKAHKAYDEALHWLLPKGIKIPQQNLKLHIQYGFSSAGSDIDNPTKSFIDATQRKYGYNDNKIMSLQIDKFVVDKGKEYIAFEFIEMTEPPTPYGARPRGRIS